MNRIRCPTGPTERPRQATTTHWLACDADWLSLEMLSWIDVAIIVLFGVVSCWFFFLTGKSGSKKKPGQLDADDTSLLRLSNSSKRFPGGATQSPGTLSSSPSSGISLVSPDVAAAESPPAPKLLKPPRYWRMIKGLYPPRMTPTHPL